MIGARCLSALSLLLGLSIPLACLEEFADPLPPPLAPIQLSPSDGAVLEVGDALTLTWTDGDPFEQYVLQIAGETGFAAPLYELTVAHDLAEFRGLGLGEYTWRVRRVATEGVAGAWSDVCSFTFVDGYWRLFGRSGGSPSGAADHGIAIVPTATGGAIILGESWGDTWIIATDPKGRELWSHRLSNDGITGNACLTGPDGSVMLLGASSYGSGGGDDVGLFDLLPSGEPNMLYIYGGSGDDIGWDLCRAPEGGLAIIGTTTSFGAGGTDAWLVRLDEDSNELWNRTYGTAGEDSAFAITPTDDGGFVFVGTCETDYSQEVHLWYARVDSAGEEVWSYTFPEAVRCWGEAIAATPDGDFIILGTGWYRSSWQWCDLILLRVDGSGRTRWGRIFGNHRPDYGRAVAVCPDGGIIIAADFWQEGLCLLKTDGEGIEQWRRYYGTPGSDACADVAITAAGDFLLLGSNRSLTGGASDIWLIKTDALGRAPGVK